MKRDAVMFTLGIAALLTLSILSGRKAFLLTPPVLNSKISVTETSEPLYHTAAKVVSVDYRSDEILLSLLPPERIIALSLDADNPEMSNIVQQAASIPLRLDLNVERILSLNPDVVVVGQVSLDDPLAMLESAGVRVIRLNSANTLSEIQQNIISIGNGVGESEAAARLVEEMKQRLSTVRAATESLRHPRTLYVYVGGASTETAGKDTYIDELLEIAGAVNVAKEAGVNSWGTLPVEKAIELNPEIIIYADSTGRDKTLEVVPTPDLAHNPVWKDILAVKTGRVYRFPGRYLFCATHLNVKTAEAIAAVLHPEVISDGRTP